MTTEDDRKYMGTRADAEAGLLAAWEAWTPYQGPLIATAKQHREHEAKARQANVVLVQAAALLAWHINDERATAEAAE